MGGPLYRKKLRVFQKNGFLQNRSNMLYLGIFILPWRRKIKFHGDRPSRKSIWTNLDPKSSIFDVFLQFLVHFFSFFVPLAGNVVLCQCRSIAHVLCLYFLVKADLLDLFSRDKMDPGQKGSRTKSVSYTHLTLPTNREV